VELRARLPAQAEHSFHHRRDRSLPDITLGSPSRRHFP
jgi:hypothetical protein